MSKQVDAEEALRMASLAAAGQTHQQIAQSLGRSLSAVTNNLPRGRAALQATVARQGRLSSKLTPPHHDLEGTSMIEPADLDLIKQAVADEAAQQGLKPGPIISLLDAIDTALEGEEPSLVPFLIGSTVEHRELAPMRGKVIQRREEGPELHSLLIAWDAGHGATATEWHSPVELREVR